MILLSQNIENSMTILNGFPRNWIFISRYGTYNGKLVIMYVIIVLVDISLFLEQSLRAKILEISQHVKYNSPIIHDYFQNFIKRQHKHLFHVIHPKTQKKNVHTCIGPGMQDRTLSMFSEVTSTSFTATRTSPENRITIKDSCVSIQNGKRSRIGTL